MKRTTKFIAAVMVMIAVIAIFQSCKKSSNTVDTNSDKTALNLQIDTANALYNAAVEGKQAGDYTVGSKAILEQSIVLANSVEAGAFIQQQVNNALANLKRAEATFQANLIQQISPENLVAYWTFSGNANDVSGNGHNGTLQTNYVGTSAATAKDGGTLPVLTADRYGAANSAYYFTNGAYIEVPYSQALYPSSFTISVWVKPAVASDGNYIFSVDHYYGYKFQLQGNNFPFLTVSEDTGIHDEDDNPGAVQLGVWSQIIATYDNTGINFYINGKLTKNVVLAGNLVPVKTLVNICIGNELPKSAYNFTDTSNPNYFYGASYFQGSLDDLRIYNTVLSAAEVNSLYVMESPN